MHRTCAVLLGAVLALGVAAGYASQQPATPTAWRSAEFSVTVAGTSTLHDWSVESRTASGEIRTGEMLAGTLQIPATSLSGGPKGLNERMYSALKTDSFPTIVFEAVGVPLNTRLDSVNTVVINGRLTIAGRANTIAVRCRTSVPQPGILLVEADVPLQMTDYGIKPPTFMGMIRTGDKVVIRVRWVLSVATADRDPVVRR